MHHCREAHSEAVAPRQSNTMLLGSCWLLCFLDVAIHEALAMEAFDDTTAVSIDGDQVRGVAWLRVVLREESA